MGEKELKKGYFPHWFNTKENWNYEGSVPDKIHFKYNTFKEKDRQDAIELLIEGTENVSKQSGYKYMFSVCRNKRLMETHKKLNWKVDERPSHEIIKIIK